MDAPRELPVADAWALTVLGIMFRQSELNLRLAKSTTSLAFDGLNFNVGRSWGSVLGDLTLSWSPIALSANVAGLSLTSLCCSFPISRWKAHVRSSVSERSIGGTGARVPVVPHFTSARFPRQQLWQLWSDLALGFVWDSMLIDRQMLPERSPSRFPTLNPTDLQRDRISFPNLSPRNISVISSAINPLFLGMFSELVCYHFLSRRRAVLFASRRP